MKKSNNTIFSLIYVFFFLSGMTALVYEILWIRKLSIIFGHTVFAMSSILSAFMGGLALGSYLAGRFADEMEAEKETKKKGLINYLRNSSYSPYIKTYGILQLIIGLYGLATPFLVDLIGDAYVGIMSKSSLGLYPISILTFLMSLVVFLIPTVCMGATLPIILKYIVKSYGEIMSKTAGLYSINTFGAVLGSFLAGFLLFPSIGLQASLMLAVVINVMIGISAIMTDAILASGEESSRETAEIPEVSAGNQPPVEDSDKSGDMSDSNSWVYPFVLIVLFISGFTSMMYQVSWTRAISLSIGSSVYSYSSILTTFLLGIAIGSYILSKSQWFSPERVNILFLANLELSIGVLGFLIIPVLGFLPYVFLRVFPFVENSYHMVIGGNFLLSFLVIILPTILIGMTFPLCIKIYTRRLDKFGGSIGKVYASNTAGNILGSFLAGFVFIPVVGAEVTLKIAVVLNLLSAVIIYTKFYKSKKINFVPLVKFAVIALVLTGVLSTGYWKKSAMTMGVSIYAKRLGQVTNWQEFKEIMDLHAEQMLFYKDGISCTVTVMRKEGENVTYLRVNGKTDASFSETQVTLDMYTQYMLGFIPAIMHPSPRRVCIIGFGSGATAGAVSLFDEVEVIDSVEIEPAVMESAHFFRNGNFNVTDSPKFRSHIADGRNFILASGEKFDIIISEPSNPWIAGIGSLFSEDFFKVAYKKLNDDGIFCQWMHTYNMEPEMVQTVFNTFYSVFPHGSVWRSNSNDYLLIGTKKEYSLDYERLVAIFDKNPQVRENFDKLGYEFPYDLLANYVVKADQARTFAFGSKLNTDDKPILEFKAPMSIYNLTSVFSIVGSLVNYRKDISEGFINISPEILENPDTFYSIAMISRKLKLFDNSLRNLEKVLELDKNYYSAYIELASHFNETENYIKAEYYLKRAIELKPDEVEAWKELVEIYRRTLPADYSLEFIEKAMLRFPNDETLMYMRADLEFLMRNFDKAEVWARKLLDAAPGKIEYKLLLANTLTEMNKSEEARKILEDLVKSSPNDIRVLFITGEMLSKQEKWEEAEEVYLKAISLFPDNTNLLLQLGQVYNQMGNYPQSLKAYRHILTRDPFNPTARQEIYNIISR
jgi:spermidine synthase